MLKMSSEMFKVFVYGTLQKGEPNYHLIEGCLSGKQPGIAKFIGEQLDFILHLGNNTSYYSLSWYCNATAIFVAMFLRVCVCARVCSDIETLMSCHVSCHVTCCSSAQSVVV